MKANAKTALKVILILVLGVAFCVLLFYIADEVFNGAFSEWYESNIVSSNVVYIPETEENMIVREPDFTKVKGLVFTALFIGVMILLVAVIISSHIYGKKKFKQAVTESARLINKYITQEKEAEAFPPEYAEISAQLAEIKADILRNEQVLKDETRRKNDLIAYLAHDLKTPLTSVIGYLSLLEEAPDLSVEQKAKYVHISLEKALRLEKLINEFFEITRYNLQQINIEKEKIDLSYMLVQMTDEFYPILKAHGNTVKLNAPENLMLSADPIKLARVFNNILKNAVAYSYQNTEIEITVKSTGNNVCISFLNKGMTIPKQKLDSIFEKFFRLNEARTTDDGGAGLGLAIAKEIVTLHGGTITAASENETIRFSVVLPI